MEQRFLLEIHLKEVFFQNLEGIIFVAHTPPLQIDTTE
jgi:hypothetical protein